MNKTIKFTIFAIVGIFAIIGFVFTSVFLGMRIGFFNVKGSIDERNSFFTQVMDTARLNGPDAQREVCVFDGKKPCDWDTTEEWMVVHGGLEKDLEIIQRVSKETGVSPRMLVAVVIPEQIRFFTANREVFKRYFEPLKILGSLSQFSLGVSGIKQETAEAIENNLLDTRSPFYLGKDFAKLIGYETGEDKKQVLYSRLTDPDNHYYSYLYTALYIKQIEKQWKEAGFDISEKPEVIVTLFNIGFSASKPNANPEVGGSEIELGGKKYLYGELGSLFYHSNIATDLFKD